MRHDDVQTTMKCYVGQDADQTAELLWQIHDSDPSSNNFGDTCQNATQSDQPENVVSGDRRKGLEELGD